MPTAVMSGASLGASRNGRYATLSIITLSTPERPSRREGDEQADDQPVAAVSCVSPSEPKTRP